MTALLRRQVAMQHGHRSFLLQRGGEAADHVLPWHCFCPGNRVADGAAGDAGRIEIEQRLELAQEGGQAAGVVEMLHVVRAGRLEVEQHRDLAAQSIEDLEVDVHAGAAGYGRQVNQAIGGSADRLQDDHGIAHGGCGDQVAWLGRAGDGHLGGALAAGLGNAAAVGVRGGRGGAHGQRQAQRFDQAGHGAGRAHQPCRCRQKGEASADQLDLGDVDGAGAVLRPEPAAIGAGAQHFASVMAHHHRPGRQHDGRQIDAGSGHDLRRQGLVAAADQHYRVHRLRTDHFLRIHRHQVAQEHRGGMGETLADGDGGKHHRQTAGEHDAALYALDQVRHVAVAGIEVAEGIGHTDDRAIEGVVGIAGRLDEGFAQEQRETGVTVAGQPLAQTPNGVSFPRIFHAAILVHGGLGRYFWPLSLFFLDGLEGGLEPLVKLREVPRVGQHRFDQSVEEDPFGERRPTGAADDFEELLMVFITREIGDCLLHLAEFSLESLQLIRGGFRL